MSRKSIRVDVLKQVVADASRVFTTRDVSEDKRTRRAHPELVKHSHYHAFVGGALSDHHVVLDIVEIQKSTPHGSRWEKQTGDRVKFSEYEVPVACSMVRLVDEQGSLSSSPLYVFSCYWMAFNNIYVTIAERKGQPPTLKRNHSGEVVTKLRAGMKIPQTEHHITERAQLDLAIAQFSDDLKHSLIAHPSAKYFVHRFPCWRGMRIEQDATGQRLNGVLNVGYTVSRDHPVWSPVDASLWEQYLGGAQGTVSRDELARQIVDVLYTVRNNTFHGGKRADDADDHEVLENAAPLLRMIVHSFLHE